MPPITGKEESPGDFSVIVSALSVKLERSYTPMQNVRK